MPHLETLQILHAPLDTEPMQLALSQAMKKAKYVYPTVTTLTCVIHLLDISPHFPNVEHVTLLHSRSSPNATPQVRYAQATIEWLNVTLRDHPAWLSSGCWENVKRLDLSSELYLYIDQGRLYERQFPPFRVLLRR